MPISGKPACSCVPTIPRNTHLPTIYGRISTLYTDYLLPKNSTTNKIWCTKLLASGGCAAHCPSSLHVDHRPVTAVSMHREGRNIVVPSVASALSMDVSGMAETGAPSNMNLPVDVLIWHSVLLVSVATSTFLPWGLKFVDQIDPLPRLYLIINEYLSL